MGVILMLLFGALAGFFLITLFLTARRFEKRLNRIRHYVVENTITVEDQSDRTRMVKTDPLLDILDED